MKSKNFLKETLLFVIIFLPLLAIAVFQSKLPPLFPLHFKGDKSFYLVILIWIVANFFRYIYSFTAQLINPKSKYENYFKLNYKIRFIISVFLTCLSLIAIGNKAGYISDMFNVFWNLTMIFYILWGNYYQSIKPNYLFGIKTAWTRDNEDVWRSTHFFASKFYFIIGFVGLCVGLFIPFNSSNFPITIVILTFSIAFVPKVYSYFKYKEIKKRELNI